MFRSGMRGPTGRRALMSSSHPKTNTAGKSRSYVKRNATDAEHGERNSQNEKPAPGFADLFDSVGQRIVGEF